MDLEQGTIFSEEPQPYGEADYLLMSAAIKKYFGIASKENFKIWIKADSGKKGKFLGVWLEKVQK